MNKRDRLHHLISLLRKRRSVTLAFLQEETGASRATLMRDLSWLRDKLGHPIHWDSGCQAYRWRPATGDHDAPQELAGLWFKPSEVLALLTLQSLIRDVQPGDFLHQQLEPLEQRLQLILRNEGVPDASEQLIRRVRIIGMGKRAVHPASFEAVGAALVGRKRLIFRYLARGSGRQSLRTVSPQRLVYYRSNWLLDAWCHQRDELRSFSVDNISQPRIEAAPAIDVPEDELDLTLGSGYGIFSGKEVQWATLRFTPERARWVAAEQWHPAQKGEWDSEGHWLLQIPYSDDRELVMDILRQTLAQAAALLSTRQKTCIHAFRAWHNPTHCASPPLSTHQLPPNHLPLLRTHRRDGQPVSALEHHHVFQLRCVAQFEQAHEPGFLEGLHVQQQPAWGIGLGGGVVVGGLGVELGGVGAGAGGYAGYAGDAGFGATGVVEEHAVAEAHGVAHEVAGLVVAYAGPGHGGVGGGQRVVDGAFVGL
ncbi:MAG: WYL domain-containing protein [Hydrogenophaga sp.]|nr:WYL domain-containing protein [Hydrogenophaga sp.]